MPTEPPGIRRVCLVVDVEGYSRHSTHTQLGIQRRMLMVIRRTCADAGVKLSRSGRQGRGDGQLIVLDPSINEARVLPGLVNGLTENLHDANIGPGLEGRMRFRAALGQGVVHVAAAGFAGDAVNKTCRLLDSAALHSALRQHQESDLALIVTDDLFADVIGGAYPGISPGDFRKVTVNVAEKNFSAEAWILVPRRSPHSAGRRSRFADPLPSDADFGSIFLLGGAAAVGVAGAIVAEQTYHAHHQADGHDSGQHADAVGHPHGPASRHGPHQPDHPSTDGPHEGHHLDPGFPYGPSPADDQPGEHHGHDLGLAGAYGSEHGEGRDGGGGEAYGYQDSGDSYGDGGGLAGYGDGGHHGS